MSNPSITYRREGPVGILVIGTKAWNAFVETNREAIEEQCGSPDEALQQAREDGGLMMGGGAAPLFCITFAEC
jgi:hypothetical protein